jgi:hypothetical protein
MNGNGEWHLTRRFLFSGGAEHRSYRFDPTANGGSYTTTATLNRNNLTDTLTLRYKLTSMTTAEATGQIIQDEFQLAAPKLDTTHSYRYMGGLEFGEGPPQRPLPRRRARLPGLERRQPPELHRPDARRPAGLTHPDATAPRRHNPARRVRPWSPCRRPRARPEHLRPLLARGR